MGKNPSHKELCTYLESELELETSRVEKLLVLRRRLDTASLDNFVSEESETRLGELYKVPEHAEDLLIMVGDERPGVQMDEQELRDVTDEMLAEMLTPREEKVIRLRYGIGEPMKYSLEEVGVQFSLTRERIRQIEAKALKKLRHRSVKRELAPFMR